MIRLMQVTSATSNDAEINHFFSERTS